MYVQLYLFFSYFHLSFFLRLIFIMLRSTCSSTKKTLRSSEKRKGHGTTVRVRRLNYTIIDGLNGKRKKRWLKIWFFHIELYATLSYFSIFGSKRSQKSSEVVTSIKIKPILVPHVDKGIVSSNIRYVFLKFFIFYLFQSSFYLLHSSEKKFRWKFSNYSSETVRSNKIVPVTVPHNNRGTIDSDVRLVFSFLNIFVLFFKSIFSYLWMLSLIFRSKKSDSLTEKECIDDVATILLLNDGGGTAISEARWVFDVM